MELPNKYRALVGTKRKLQGYIFSYSKEIKSPKEFTVLKASFASARVIENINDPNSKQYATFKLLLKSPDMKKAQWTKPMPCMDLELTDSEWDEDEE